MATLRIRCPSCGTEGTLSLVESYYDGPYTCWSCHALFSMKIRDGQLKSLEPLSQEELRRQQEAEALKAKFRRRPSGKD